MVNTGDYEPGLKKVQQVFNRLDLCVRLKEHCKVMYDSSNLCIRPIYCFMQNNYSVGGIISKMMVIRGIVVGCSTERTMLSSKTGKRVRMCNCSDCCEITKDNEVILRDGSKAEVLHIILVSTPSSSILKACGEVWHSLDAASLLVEGTAEALAAHVDLVPAQAHQPRQKTFVDSSIVPHF